MLSQPRRRVRSGEPGGDKMVKEGERAEENGVRRVVWIPNELDEIIERVRKNLESQEVDSTETPFSGI